MQRRGFFKRAIGLAALAPLAALGAQAKRPHILLHSARPWTSWQSGSGKARR